jgi:hypothetical protein
MRKEDSVAYWEVFTWKERGELQKPQLGRYVVRTRFETRTLLIQVIKLNCWMNLLCHWMFNVRLVIECVLFGLQTDNSGCLFELTKSCISLLWACVEQNVFFLSWRNIPQWASTSSPSRLQDHTQTHHTQYGSSGRVISPTQRPLPDNTQYSQEREVHPWCQRDSNSHSQQGSARRHTT